MNRILKTIGWLLVISACATPGKSDASSTPVVVYDTFGAGNTYNTQVGWGITGSATSSGYRAQAQPFVPSITGDLTAIGLAIGRSSGSGLNNIFVDADNGGVPGTVLETFGSVACPGRFGQTYPLLTLNSVAQPILQAGETYWLAIEPADTTTISAWNDNTVNSDGTFGYAFSPGSWNTLPSGPPGGAFRITVEPVPEPQAWIIMGLAGGILVIRSGRAQPQRG